MKKAVWKAAAVLMCFSLFTGCGKSTDTKKTETAQKVEKSEQKDNGQVSLKIWSEDTNFEVLNKMIDSFKEEYKGQAEFDIQLEQSSDSETKEKALGDIHNAPDIFPMADDQVASMAAGGAICEVPDADKIKSENVKEAVDAASINDVLYAYPYSADNGYFLYYNKDYFKEEDVQTLDQVLEVCKNAGKKFSMEWDSGWYTYAFFGNTGLDFGINEDGVTNHCNWNTTEGDVKGIDVARAMLAVAKNPGFLNLPDGELVGKIKEGTVIAAVSGIWNATEIAEAWGEYGAVKLPTYTLGDKQVQMASFTGYKMYGVNAYSAHKEWACKLAEWLSNEENQTLRFEMRNQGPSNINAANSEEVKKVPAIQAVLAQSEFGVLQRVGNSFWTPMTEYGETLAKGEIKDEELQELLDRTVKGVTASVAE